MPEERPYYWASSSQNIPVVSNRPSPFYVPFLAITNDEPPREELTPFLHVSESLCGLSAFFKLLTVAQPSLDGYQSPMHMQNEVASWLIRFAYWIVICRKQNFNSSFIPPLDAYIAKCVYIQGEVSNDILRLLSEFKVPAIVVCDLPVTVQMAVRAGLDAHLDDPYTRATLGEIIGARFALPTAELLRKGYKENEILPAQVIERYPKQFQFGESRIQPVPVSGLLLTAPNEILANSMRRRVPGRARSSQPPADQRVPMLLDSVRLVIAQKLADYLVIMEQEDPMPDLDPALRRSIERYTSSSSAADYEQLVDDAKNHIGSHARAEDFILCCPAFNRHIPYKLFRGKIPDRVLKYVFRQRSADYINWFSRNEFRSETDFQLAFGLQLIQGMEFKYITDCLTLYALALRRPVLRTPQLSGALFGKLKHLRLTLAQGSRSTFSKHLPEVAAAMASEIPPDMLEFIAHNKAGSLKLVSDLPLEWLPINGVPLMFQRTLSRVPMTPGNVLLNHYSDARNNVVIGKRELKKILVLNCFSESDHLFDYPKRLVRVTAETGQECLYGEARSLKEYQKTLAKHKPFVLIHWGHGSYDRSADRGFLHLGAEQIEIWEFKETVIPPIVILAGCETSAIAETHNTPANAWLALGARAVLGTYFPVQADLTLVLVTRILANLFEAIMGKQFLPTWELVVSKTLMLNRYLDFLNGFDEYLSSKGLKSVPREFILEYTYQWNHHSEHDVGRLYTLCPEIMAAAMRRFGQVYEDKFREYLAVESPLPHTMFFTHLGSPESILLRKTRGQSDLGNPAERYWSHRQRQDRLKTRFRRVSS
jgi:hypothetical protein